MTLKQSIQNFEESESLSFLFEINEKKQKLLKDFPITFVTQEKISKYGKYDHKGNPIIPRKEKIVNNFFDFVEEMFTNLHNYLKFSYFRGVISNENFSNIQIKKSFQLAEDSYENFLTTMKQAILERMNNQSEINKSTNEKENLNRNVYEFVDFIKSDLVQKNVINNLPLTGISYITSEIVSPLSTCLSLEIDDSDYNDEFYKFNLYYNNADFLFYVNACNQFGFRVDINIPWRLFVDLKSPFVIKLLSKKNIFSLDKFFSEYYNLYVQNLNTLMLYFNNIYTEYINLHPTYKETIFKNNNTVSKIRQRNKTLLDLSNNNDFMLLIDLYVDMFLKEHSVDTFFIKSDLKKMYTRGKKFLDKRDLGAYIIKRLNKIVLCL